jgi:hypothetical protein
MRSQQALQCWRAARILAPGATQRSSCRPARCRRGILMIFDAECFDLDVPDELLRADLIMDKVSQDYSRFSPLSRIAGSMRRR